MTRNQIFYKIGSLQVVAENLSRKVSDKLEQGLVLLLLSGGSARGVAVETAKKLKNNPNLSRLSISLVDERYGPVDHADSNWQQLLDSGFELTGAKLHPVLEGYDIQTTTINFNDFLAHNLKPGTYGLALLGMGADGHTAGILPHSQALRSQQLATYYEAADYQRITITPAGLKRLDEAILYAAGSTKQSQLVALASKNLDLADQPAQIIKQINHWSVYNDVIGEAI